MSNKYLLVFSITLAVASAAALAQNKPEQGAGQLEEVVVIGIHT